jgi:hypothetical protein
MRLRRQSKPPGSIQQLACRLVFVHNNQFFTNPIHNANEGEAMRIVLAAIGLLLVAGMGGAYAVMHGLPALRNTPNVAAKSPGIPKAESARLFLLSGVSTQPPKPVAKPAPRAAPRAMAHVKPSAGKSTLTKTAKPKVKLAASNRVAKSKPP